MQGVRRMGAARAAGAAVLALLVAAPPAAAQLRLPLRDPDYALTSWANAHGRGLDQARHPDYQARKLPAYRAAAAQAPGWERQFFTDPYLAEEGPRRARWQEVEFLNRYGARLRAILIAPKAPGTYPGLVIEPGGDGPRWGYLALAQGLAESGYVTMTITAQGDADADRDPADPVPSTPENEHCRPHDHGGWQAGEGGIAEPGRCAGHVGDLPPPLSNEEILRAGLNGDATLPGLDQAYRAQTARKAFAVLDATRWMASNAESLQVDAGRIGAAGHSFGAQGAMVAGQIDSHRLIDAVVAWDGFGPLDVPPRVPTMFQASEARGHAGPRRDPPSPEAHPASLAAARFRAAGVPSMALTLAESSHQEWNYRPYLGVVVGALVVNGDPFAAEGSMASRYGERVALHYTLAWFDRWLKPGSEASARDRLLARRFDASADRVAIGQGIWDPVRLRNVPYRIAGREVASHLSPWFTSRADFDGLVCPDLRAGC